jgi:hypothetical protein
MIADEIVNPEEALHDALRRMSPEALDEALNRSLGRVYTQTKTRSIGIMSASLDTNTPEQNLASRHELKRAIKRGGFGHAHVRGVGQESGYPVPEPSLLLIGTEGDDPRLKQFLIRNGRKHRQYSVLYKSGASDRAIEIYTRDDPARGVHDGQEVDRGIWHPNRSAAQFLTRLKGDRSFTFAKEGQDRIVYTHPFGFFTRGEALM